jgi:hypothetical protein
MRGMIAPVAAGLALVAAAPAGAQPLPGATYVGAYDAGRLEFDISGDGKRVTRLRQTTLGGELCSSSSYARGEGVPIADDTFAGPFPPLFMAGTLSGRSASGTVSVSAPSGACPQGRFSWTAVADTKAPAFSLTPGPMRRTSVVIEVFCPDEVCAAQAKGVVSVRAGGVARRFKLQHADAVGRFESTLRLKIPRRASLALEAVGRRGRLIAKVRVVVSDRFGNSASKTKTIRLPR